MKKTILITGSTDGIGKLAAQSLASEGHTVYLHGRNASKLQAAVEALKAQTSNANIHGVLADFADLPAVAELGKTLNRELPALDVLINNAGIFQTQAPQTASGLDIRFVVNYLAPYLLTRELMPLLEKTSGARIVNLSSAAQAPVDANALQGRLPLGAQEAYAQSKLALTMWSCSLASELASTSVLAVNPGSLLNTKMVQEAYGHHWSTADKGASLLHDLAVAPGFEGHTGQYFDNDLGNPRGNFGRAHADAYNPDNVANLRSLTDQLLAQHL